MERESIAWAIPERNRGDARSRRWKWLKAGELKQETESLICAAQERALRTNAIKNDIDHQDVSPLCRLCKDKVEGVSNIVS